MRWIPVFYTSRQVAITSSTSPSAGKPAKVVARWQDLGLPIRVFEPTPVTPADFALVHERSFVEDVLALRRNNGFGNRSAAVAASLPYTTGAMLTAARYVLENGGVACAPCSGFHHAGFDGPSGYCTFNGLVVTAMKLQEEGRVKRVGILDCDQHYGDGTEDLIRYHSLSPWLRHVTAGKHYERHAPTLLSRLPALMKLFAKCDVLLYQAGADPHVDDPLGGFMTDEQLAQRDAIVFAEAKTMKLPIVWNLAGGYQEPLPKVLDIHDRTMQACIAAYCERRAR